MSRVLLDENLPVGLADRLPDHDVDHVIRLGWSGVANGGLIAKAERDGYEVLVTADKSLRYQQNLGVRAVSIVLLSTNQWPTIRMSMDRVADAGGRALPFGLQDIELQQGSRGDET